MIIKENQGEKCIRSESRKTRICGISHLMMWLFFFLFLKHKGSPRVAPQNVTLLTFHYHFLIIILLSGDFLKSSSYRKPITSLT